MTVLQDMPMYLYYYDNNGNVVAFGYANYDGTGAGVRETYTYDSLNQLVRTNSLLQNATWVYDYDDSGNILSKKRYAYTTGDLSGLTPVETINYTYGNENWGDLLTAYNGKAITYDEIGNPLTYDGWTYTWKDGRRLATASDGTNTLSYKYNADGIRTSKTVNGTTTEYFLNGTQIIAQKTGDDIMWFYYDHNGKRIGLEYQGAMYYYIYNLQGDVEAIANSNGVLCGQYYYDDWGRITSISNIGSNTVANANPFRYRGYYYDSETELYYLNSRYYNPEWGRFLNADGIIGANGDVISTNLFAYCSNNPINFSDPTGTCMWDVVRGPAGDNLRRAERCLYQMLKDTAHKEEYSGGTLYIFDGIYDVELAENIPVFGGDLVVLDKRYSDDPDMQIINSIKITDESTMEEICGVIINYHNNTKTEDCVWDRECESMVVEWVWHNELYADGIFVSNSQHVDFNMGLFANSEWDFLQKVGAFFEYVFKI